MKKIKKIKLPKVGLQKPVKSRPSLNMASGTILPTRIRKYHETRGRLS
jgi:hypothetical protein